MPTVLDVFISYKREQGRLRDQVIAALEAEGFTTFADPDIKTGANFATILDQMLRKARLTLVLWTPEATTSRWIPMEARRARNLQRENEPNIYLPIYIGIRGTQLPIDLDNLQGLDVRDGLTEEGLLRDEDLARLVNKVTEDLGAPRRDEAKPAPQASKEIARDFEDFDAAAKTDSNAGYIDYLRNHPDGQFRELASRKLQVEKETPKPTPQTQGRGRLSLIAAVIVALLILLDGFVTRQTAFAGQLTKTLVEPLGIRAVFRCNTVAGTPGITLPRRTTCHALDATSLAINDKNFTDLGQLRDLSQLESLNLNETGITSLEPIAAFPKLRSLEIACTDVDDLSPLGALRDPKLRKLVISHTDIHNISAVANLKALQVFEANDTQVHAIDVLADLTDLRTAFISHTDIWNLAPLTEHRKLEVLTVSGTRVSTVAPLTDVKSLKVLNINHLRIDDFSPLQGLERLHWMQMPDSTVLNTDEKVALAVRSAPPSPRPPPQNPKKSCS